MFSQASQDLEHGRVPRARAQTWTSRDHRHQDGKSPEVQHKELQLDPVGGRECEVSPLIWFRGLMGATRICLVTEPRLKTTSSWSCPCEPRAQVSQGRWVFREKQSWPFQVPEISTTG